MKYELMTFQEHPVCVKRTTSCNKFIVYKLQTFTETSVEILHQRFHYQYIKSHTTDEITQLQCWRVLMSTTKWITESSSEMNNTEIYESQRDELLKGYTFYPNFSLKFIGFATGQVHKSVCNNHNIYLYRGLKNIFFKILTTDIFVIICIAFFHRHL